MEEFADIAEKTNELADLLGVERTLTVDHLWHPVKGVVKVWDIKHD